MKKESGKPRVKAFNKAFSYDGGFYTYTSKIFDMLLLNLLWLIGCIPVITAGASFSALYFVTVHSVRGDEKGVFKEFWRVWKRDFKDSLPVWLIALAMYFVLFLNLGILREQEPKLIWLFFIVFFVLVLAFLTVFCCYFFPALSTFQMPKKWLLRFSFYAEIKHLPLSLILGAMFAGMYFAMMAVPWLIVVFPSVFALFSSFIIEPVFAKHKDENQDENQIDNNS